MAKYVGFKIGKVHESHVISEYYCGGCGWPVTDHDSFCPECGGAFRECDASNLEDENAKLRELVADMYKAFMHGNCYRWCEFKEPCNYISDGRCQWYDRMRDLGVEVDG